jgi:hypothetical protein
MNVPEEKRFKRLYAGVAVYLVLVIVLFTLFTRTFNR